MYVFVCLCVCVCERVSSVRKQYNAVTVFIGMGSDIDCLLYQQ